MILVFTGTGNSKFIADALADKLHDQIVSMNDIIKNNETPEFNSEKPYVIVAPIYAWRYPRVVDDILEKGTFEGNKDIYFIATMGSQSGNCYKYCNEIADKAGLNYKGFTGIAMPDNFVSFSKMDDEATTDKIIEKALPVVKRIVHAIKNGNEIHKRDKTPMAGLLSGPVNNMFTKYMCDAKKYVVSDECIKCGLCVKKCPLNNVSMEDGNNPVFGKNCINCYACIQYCPKQAINIPGRTENHGRYTCKEYKTVKAAALAKKQADKR